MSTNQKYYYLKFKEDFFETDEIKIIESMPNGYLYTNILLKMYLKSLKRNGKLMMTDRIPYSPNTLATVTGHDIDHVLTALNIFVEFALVEILDNGTMYMLDIQNYIGKSTTEADRKREYRRIINEEKEATMLPESIYSDTQGQVSDKSPEDKIPGHLSDKSPTSHMSGQMSDKSTGIRGQMSETCPTEVLPGHLSDKNPPDKEIEIDRELEIDNICQQIKCLYNQICNGPFYPVKSITQKQKEYIRLAFTDGKKLEDFEQLFRTVKKSNRYNGNNSSNFVAAFGFIINPANMSNILKSTSKKTSHNKFHNFEQRKIDFNSIEKQLMNKHVQQCQNSHQEEV